jgi:predicted nucleic acid-binding Zn ribbon protein
MEANLATKQCLSCARPIKGRSDKKFCDDYCRNAFNNQLKGGTNNFMRNVNNALRSNRRILESLLPQGERTVKLRKEILLQQGFSFIHLTHTYLTKNGSQYFFCYEYGYLPLESGWYLVVKKSKE